MVPKLHSTTVWCRWFSRKHGRGSRGAVPASDAAGHGDARATPLPARPTASGHVSFFFFSRLAPTLLRLGPYRAKRPIQAMAEAKPAWQRRRLLLLLFVLLLPAWQRRRLLLLRFVRSFFFFSFLRFVRPFQLYFKFSLPCFMFCELSTWVDLALFYVCELSTWVDVRNDKEIWQNFIFTGHT